MDNKIKLVQKFKVKVNDIFDFSNENIPKLYPKDSYKYLTEINNYHDKLEAGLKVNSMLILDEFSLSILQYIDKIHNRDINYMLNDTPDSNVLKEGTKLDFSMFKCMWKAIDINNPEHYQIREKLIEKIINITTIAENYFNLVYG